MVVDTCHSYYDLVILEADYLEVVYHYAHPTFWDWWNTCCSVLLLLVVTDEEVVVEEVVAAVDHHLAMWVGHLDHHPIDVGAIDSILDRIRVDRP